MTVLQAAALTLVVITAVAVVAAYDPLRQTVLVSIFGLSLVVAFMTFAAPDVAISELVVSMVAFPTILLAAIHRTRAEPQGEAAQQATESGGQAEDS